MSKIKLLAVIVIYNSIYTKSHTYKSLLNLNGISNFELTCLVYDNSEICDIKKANSAMDCGNTSVIYYLANDNGGTQAAYLKALDVCRALKVDWVLLLDQDTTLPVNYLEQLYEKIQASNYSILLPNVICLGRMISPSIINHFGSITPYKKNRSNLNISYHRITGIASGMLIKPSVLLSLQIEKSCLWLDYLDHWMLFRASQLGYKVVVLNIELSHDLSISNPVTLGNKRRFDILKSEYIFYKALGGIPLLLYPVRVVYRVVHLFHIDYTCALSFIAYSFRRMLSSYKS